MKAARERRSWSCASSLRYGAIETYIAGQLDQWD